MYYRQPEHQEVHNKQQAYSINPTPTYNTCVICLSYDAMLCLLSWSKSKE